MAGKKKEEISGNGYLVITEFRDKNDWNILYSVGQDVSDLDDERLLELIEKGLVSNEVSPEA